MRFSRAVSAASTSSSWHIGHPAVSAPLGRAAGDVPAVVPDSALDDRDQPGDRPQQRALAGPVRPDDRDDLARTGLDADASNDQPGAVARGHRLRDEAGLAATAIHASSCPTISIVTPSPRSSSSRSAIDSARVGLTSAIGSSSRSSFGAAIKACISSMCPRQSLALPSRCPEQQDLDRGQPVEHVGLLKRPDDAAACDLVRLAAGDVRAVEANAATTWSRPTTDQVDHRRLARVVRPDEAGDRAALDEERDFGDGPHASEGTGQRRHLEQDGRGPEVWSQLEPHRLGPSAASLASSLLSLLCRALAVTGACVRGSSRWAGTRGAAASTRRSPPTGSRRARPDSRTAAAPASPPRSRSGRAACRALCRAGSPGHR